MRWAVWFAAGGVLAGASASPEPFKPRAEEQVQEAQAWERLEMLLGRRYWATEFLSSDPAAVILARHAPDISAQAKDREAWVADIRRICGDWAVNQPVKLTLELLVMMGRAAGEGEPEDSPDDVEMKRGVAGITEDGFRLLRQIRLAFRRGHARVKWLTPRQEAQQGEAEAEAEELRRHLSRFANSIEGFSRLERLNARMWAKYEDAFLEAVRASRDLPALRTALETRWKPLEPAWPRLEERLWKEGLPPEEAFAVWREAVLQAGSGRRGDRPARFLAEALSGRAVRPQRIMVIDEQLAE